MKTFDPKNKKSRHGFDRRDRQEDFFNRDDSRSFDRDEPASAFAKDKRPRISRPAPEHQHHREGNDERRSFNPNFTRDNRRKDEDSYHKRPYSRDSDEQSRDRSWNREDRPARSWQNREGNREDRPARPWQNRDGNREDRPARPWQNREGNREDRPARPWQNREGNREDRPARPWQNREGNREDRPAKPWQNREGNREDRPARPWQKREGDRSGSSSRPWEKKGDRPTKPWDREGRSDDRRQDRAPRKKSFPAYGKDNYPRFDAPKMTGAIRLNRFIANSGICSRREADDLITAGLVSVNGKIVTELGTKVNPEDEVRFNDSIVHGEKKVYIVMNKPKGYVTSLDDPHADKTVMDLIKGACTERVYPVGRLDKNSVGVLLITNDGELTRQLTHPSYNKRKVYQVTLDKALTQADMEKIAEGIVLEDGPIYADEISYVSESRKEAGIEIHSGRNRIVRRIFESLGYTVQKLDRVYFAGLTKKNLKRGGWRFLTPREVSALKSGAYE